jgi:phage terminase Nu1 subunit (DNA packaging protein)
MSGKAKDGRTYTNTQAAALLGIDLATVKRWRARGFIVNRPDGSLDEAATRARANANRDPTHGGRPDRVFGGAPLEAHRADVPACRPLVRSSFADPGADSPVGDAARLLKARAISATADAKLKQLRIQERLGELIPRATAAQVYADTLATARSALEALPVRTAHRLVGLDAAAIRRLLQEEVAAVLQEISNGLDATR